MTSREDRHVAPGGIRERAGRGHLPPWFRTRLPKGEKYRRLRRILEEERLPTICNGAICPNRGECWSRGIATFLILGEVCTRACAFCNVRTGRPGGVDRDEPRRVARAVRDLGLRHIVITSVDRDDLSDGGAGHYARVIAAIREASPDCAVEVLVPDFRGDREAAGRVIEAAPDVFGHNVETVPSLYRTARRGSDYRRSLGVLRHAAAAAGGMLVKTGLMVGLGESRGELRQTMAEIRETGCDMLTVGQYLRPSPDHLEVVRFYEPEAFEAIRAEAHALGFPRVMTGPLVRSSYLADAQVRG